MPQGKFWRRLLQSSAMIGAASIGGQLSAQVTPQETAADTGDTIVVTGSLIARDKNLVETSPVTSVDAEAFDIQGTLRVEDLINNLPQAFAAQGSNLANGASGTASIDLRGLGSERTLTLMNGRRLPYGSVNIYAPDVNFIPAALVERVDVLTGGASATYGADAVAGVVNFIIDDDFQGFRIDANGSFFQHNNDNDIQDLLNEFAAVNPNQYEVPDGSFTTGGSFDVTAVFGAEMDNGRGNITGYVGYQNTNEILQGDYDYSQCALGTRNSGTEFTCSGSSTNEIANLLDVSGTYAIPGAVTPNVSGEEYVAPSGWARVLGGQDEIGPRTFDTDTFNFNPFNHYQRPNERYNAGMFVQYDVTENVELYSEFQFMDNRTNSQIAPSGVFGYGVAGGAGGINCDNPFLSAQQVEYLCGEVADGTFNRRRDVDGNLINLDGVRLDADDTDTDGDGELDNDVLGNNDLFFPDGDGLPDQAALAADGIAPGLLVLRRNVEGGQRNNDIRHTTFRGVFGMRGQIGNSPFNYDIYAQYANTHRSETYNNDLSIQNITRALYAVDDGEGNIVCAVNADDSISNDDPNCVPYDIFGADGPSPEAVAYLASPLNRDGNTEQWVVSALINGDLTDYGFASPFASEGIAFAAGVEYREDFVDSRPDRAFQDGDGAGQGGPTNPISGRLEVIDYFAEVNVPLISDAPFADTLGFDAAYRYSDYDNFEASSYKFGGEWAPHPDLRLRASYQRAVRAPNIFELFAVQSIGLFDLTAGENGLFDPCAGSSPEASAAECARTGVTSGQYGTIADNPAGQFNTFTGGNPDLDPETADTYTFGFVFSPSTFLEGLTLSVDYFDISVEDFVGTVPEQLSLNQCLETGDEFFCSLVNRGNGGTLWANQTGFITATNLNTGELSTTGVDINAVYDFVLPEGMGDLRVNLIGTYLDELFTKPLPTSGADQSYDCAGLYAGQCGLPNPEWRHQFRVTWTTPVDLQLNATWRYIDEVKIAQSSDQPALAGAFSEVNETLEAESYLDLSAIYPLNDNVMLRGGINNVLDNDPPLSSVVGTAPGNGNTYPQLYNSFGRYVFFGAQIDF